MNITGSNNRIYYKRPNPDTSTTNGNTNNYGTIGFIVHSGRNSNGYTTSSSSYEGIVTLVPSNGIYKSSNFLLNDEDWSIIGNKMTTRYVYVCVCIYVCI